MLALVVAPVRGRGHKATMQSLNLGNWNDTDIPAILLL